MRRHADDRSQLPMEIGPASRATAKSSAARLFACAGVERTHTGEQGGEFSNLYSMTHAPHSVKVMGQVVDGVEHASQQLSSHEQVAQIGAGIARAHPAGTLR